MRTKRWWDNKPWYFAHFDTNRRKSRKQKFNKFTSILTTRQFLNILLVAKQQIYYDFRRNIFVIRSRYSNFVSKKNLINFFHSKKIQNFFIQMSFYIFLSRWKLSYIFKKRVVNCENFLIEQSFVENFLWSMSNDSILIFFSMLNYQRLSQWNVRLLCFSISFLLIYIEHLRFFCVVDFDFSITNNFVNRYL